MFFLSIVRADDVERDPQVLSYREIMEAPPRIINKINEALGNTPITGPTDRRDFDDQMTNLFSIIDTDESRTLSIEEFCSGIAPKLPTKSNSSRKMTNLRIIRRPSNVRQVRIKFVET